MRPAYVLGLVIGLTAAATALAQGPEATETSCTICHSDGDLVQQGHLEIVTDFSQDVHSEVGLSCHDCHGGNPDPVVADDPELAMDASFADNPYRGAWDPMDIPSACGRCHSDPSYMRTYKPAARVDQETEYRVSRHGLALQQGDTAVATCTSCHGTHGIKRSSDPASPVYPTNVAETCSGCHSDAEAMAGRTLADGRPLLVDQHARWSLSVHAQALLEKEDLFAPTCNDCHGNHGAAPPGFDSLSFVCGQCHRREAESFLQSPKFAGLESHVDYMAASESCADCHAEPEPQAAIEEHIQLVGCSMCHGNHAVVRPTIAMLSPLPETPCAFCHEASGPRSEVLGRPESSLRAYESKRDSLLATARASGLDGEALFDALVDQALLLPEHTLHESEGELARVLRPEFARLFTKFRIGKTHLEYIDPATGEVRHERIRRCSDCHAREPAFTDDPVGLQVSASILEMTRGLTAQIGRGERTLLAARRGGVQTSGVELALGRAIDAQIELEALAHTFSVDDGGAFSERSREGYELARLALLAGDEALEELQSRRRGLGVSLLFIFLALVALALKIRML